ncbi:hypothetical protein [Gordonia shandongensis]|uniref:hypothetical protein n=1 Tax=Gordonia shandongensis TaxID=376351 RepID=UPI00040B00BA|nr:hypothetical protein [Gordonia shandongensis]
MSAESGDRTPEIEELRRRLHRMSGGPVQMEQGRPAPHRTGRDESGRDRVSTVPVPRALADLFPRGGLPRGSVTAMSGASVIPMSIIAEASARGATVALVGLPRLNLAAAAELGADLTRIAVVADPGADRFETAAVLLDGIDLVVLGFEGRSGPVTASVPPSRARVLAGRARKQASTLMVLGDWPGGAARVRGDVVTYRHLPVRRSGYGRIGGFQVAVEVRAPGARPVLGTVDLVTPGWGEAETMRLDRIEPVRTTLEVAN